MTSISKWFLGITVACHLLTATPNGEAAPAPQPTPIATLALPNAKPNEYLGLSAATDGQRVFLGTGDGTAYLYNPFTAQQLAKVSLPNSTWYGSVALEGNTGVFGGQGTAKVFDFTNLGAVTSKSLIPTGGVLNSFNAAVDISGDNIIVGANYESAQGEYSGAAYLFDRATGTQYAKLTPADGRPSDMFGTSVAIDGNMAVVGAPNTTMPNSAAYLFNAEQGFAGNRQVGKYNVAQGSAAPGVGFGYDVDISGTKILSVEVSGQAFLWPNRAAPAPLSNSQDGYFAPGNNRIAFNGQYVALGDPMLGRIAFYNAQGRFLKWLSGPANAPIGFGGSIAIGGDLLVVNASGGDPKKTLVYVYRLSEAVITPEPATASLVAVGLLTLGGMARRGRNGRRG